MQHDVHTSLPLQFLGNRRELLKSRLKIVGDFLGEDVGGGQVVGVFQALVFQPENIEVRLVGRQEIR